MNFNQWFWKYGYIAVIPIALLGLWISGSDERQNQSNVNPELFELFKKVESDCQAEDFNNQSAACIAIAKYQKECEKVTVACNSSTFYQLLREQGFSLPQYYRQGYLPK